MNVSIYKTKKILLFFVLLLFLFLYFLYVPNVYGINRNLTAMTVNGINNQVLNTAVTIIGSYSNYLFSSDKFEGNIIIKGYNTTNTSYKVNVTLNPYEIQYLYYTSYNGLEVRRKPFGVIIANEGFKSFIIVPFDEYIYNPSYNETHGSVTFNEDSITVICYPAETREEAIILINKVLGKKVKNFSIK